MPPPAVTPLAAQEKEEGGELNVNYEGISVDPWLAQNRSEKDEEEDEDKEEEGVSS